MEPIQIYIYFIGVLVLTATPDPTSREFHFINEPMSWDEARDFCRLRYSDLASVRHMRDHHRLFGLLLSRPTPSSWIGLRRTGTRSWKWSDGEGTAQYTAWGEGEPNNVSGNDWCVEMYPDGTWNDISCSDSKQFVCYELSEDNLVRFVHYSTTNDWKSSQNTCRKQHTDLATIWNSDTTSAIRPLVQSGTRVWFGLFNDDWEWSDGSDTSYRFWVEGGEHGGACAALSMELGGFWVAQNCDGRATFICEGGLKARRIWLKISVSSSVDLTDSTFIPKIDQQLADGVLGPWSESAGGQMPTDLKLLWKKDKDKRVFHRQGIAKEEEKSCPSNFPTKK